MKREGHKHTALWSSQPCKSLPGGRHEEELAENYFFWNLKFVFLLSWEGDYVTIYVTYSVFFFFQTT